MLVSRRHLQPLQAEACLHAYQAPWQARGRVLRDLSDHYAVCARLAYDL